MNTLILMWNPDFSSYTLDQFREELDNFENEYFNWSVWDYKNSHDGDKFFLVRVGNHGNRGVVMSGIFDSDPWEGEDWSGKGRQVFYQDMRPEVMIDSEKCPILTQEEMMKAIPDFDWTGGHSGRVLSEEQAQKLDELWNSFIAEHKDIFDGNDAISVYNQD